MNLLRRTTKHDTQLCIEDSHYEDEEEAIPNPPAFCTRISPEQMKEQSRIATEQRLRELDEYLKAHPEGTSDMCF